MFSLGSGFPRHDKFYRDRTYSSNVAFAFTAFSEPNMGIVQQEGDGPGTQYRGLHPTVVLASVASVGESTSVATVLAQQDRRAKHLRRACAYPVRSAVPEDPKAQSFATVEF